MRAMSSGLVAYAVFALLACSTLAVPDTGRNLLKSASVSSSTSASSNKPKGSATASSNLRVQDGEGTVEAQADAQALEKSNNEIKTIIREVVTDFPQKGDQSDTQFCQDVSVFLEEDAQSVGVAAAQASVGAFGVVTIDGIGSGCASTEASASATALATVELVVNAWAEVRSKDGNAAKAQARLKSLTNVLAQAAAKATAKACVESDGSEPAFAEAYQTVVAKAYGKAVASILVFLEAAIDCAGATDVFADAEVGAEVKEEDKEVDVEVDSGTTTKGGGTAVATAEGSATVVQVVPCSTQGRKRLCCKGKNTRNENTTCYCTLSGKKSFRNSCEATKKTVDGVLIWEYRENDEDKACKC